MAFINRCLYLLCAPKFVLKSAHNSGLILIAVLGVTGLVAVFMTLQMTNLNQSTTRLSAITESQQLKYNSYSAINLAAEVLIRDFNKNTSDGAGDNWHNYRTWKSFPLEDGSTLAIKVQDASGLFNLNDLRTSKDEHLKRLRKLLRYNNLNPNLAGAIADWVDGNRIASAYGGQEDNYYKLIGNNQVTRKTLGEQSYHIADLQGVWNLTEPELMKLAEITTTLEVNNYKNVNSLDPMFLRTLYPSANYSSHAQYIASDKYKDVNDFLNNIGEEENAKYTRFSLSSMHFLLHLQVKSGTMVRKAIALLERNNEQIKIRSLWWH